MFLGLPVTTKVLNNRLPAPAPSILFCHAPCALAIRFARSTASSYGVSWSLYTTISLTVAILHAWIWKLRTLKPSLGSMSRNSYSSHLLSLAACNGRNNSSGAIAPLTLLCDRSPPVFTIVSPRIHFGVRLSDFLRAVKNASCSWLSGCNPCIHGNTCFAEGSGCEARCSTARASFSALKAYTGGSVETESKPLGG